MRSRVDDRREPVADAHDRAARARVGEAAAQVGLGAGVERARRLVEDEDGRVAEQRAGDGEALALPAAHAHAAVAEDGLVAGREARDELVQLGRLGGGDDLLVGRVGAAERDVRPHRRVEDEGVLEDHAELAPQRLDADVAHVLAVDEHAPGRRVVEAQQQVQQARLAGPRRPDEGDMRADRDPQARRVEGRPARAVRERDVLEDDLVAQHVELDRVGPVDDPRRLVEQLLDPAHRARRGLRVLRRLAELVDRLQHGRGEADRGEQRAQAQVALDDEVAAEAEDLDLGDGGHHPDACLQPRAGHHEAVGGHEHAVQADAVGRERAVLAAVGLDEVVCGRRLLEHGGRVARLLPGARSSGCGSACEAPCGRSRTAAARWRRGSRCRR